MKKTLKFAMASAVLLIFTLGIGLQYAHAQSIGYIDVTRIFREYKKSVDAQSELDKKGKELDEQFRKDFGDAQQKLLKAKTDGKTDKEIEKMAEELDAELETKYSPKKDELERRRDELTSDLQKNILSSVEKVAKKVGIDMVLDKQVFIIGGVDLTDMVLNELNR